MPVCGLQYNVACSPKEEKFRRIKLTNKTIQSAVVEVPGAVELLLALGWAYEEVEGGEAGAALVIPAGAVWRPARKVFVSILTYGSA